MLDDRGKAGFLFLVASAQFITVLMLGETMAPGYSVHTNAISDLGVIPETRLLFNASLLLVGVLNAVAGYFFYRVHGKRVILALFLAAGIGVAGAAIFPLDQGVHGLFALIAFIFCNVEAIATARLLNHPMNSISAALGSIGLIFLALHVAGDIGGVTAAYGPIGHGGSERMIVYPVLVWLMALGGYLMAQKTGE